jgi:phage terminase large subunit
MEVMITPVFEKMQRTKKKIIVNVGGARSSKSYSTCQYLIQKFNNERNISILISRKTLPSLRMTAMKTFISMLKDYKRFGLCEYNKMERVIYFPNNNNYVYFTSIDDPEKVKSTEFNYIWFEEAIELSWEEYIILLTRLSAQREDDDENQIILTLNPSDEQHWINQKLRLDEDVEFMYSTYKDNPTLSKSYIHTLEGLAKQDEQFYKIYTLGEWATPENLIFTNWLATSNSPYNLEPIYGLDFGYNSATALTEVRYDPAFNKLFFKQRIYETGLDAEKMTELIKATIYPKKAFCYADPEDPRAIDMLYKAGINIHKADKDVVAGIRYLKSFDIEVHCDSVDGIKEMRNYKWKKDKNGNILDEPVKFMDHFVDSARYAVFSHGPKYWKATGGIPSLKGRLKKHSITEGY